MGCSTSKAFSAKEDWRVLKKIGEGSSAEVFAVKHTRSNEIAALRVPRGGTDENENEKTDAMREIMVLKTFGKHDNIVGLIDDFMHEGRRAMLMEKCEGSLSSCIGGMPVASETIVVPILRQMAAAIAHIHTFNIVHRDVKPDNFLWNSRERHTLKLCDFGFARIMPSSGVLYGSYGTPIFMSPEMVGPGAHNLKTDVWSLGACWYLMLYGEYPYAAMPLTAANVMQAILNDNPKPRYQGRGSVRPLAKESVSTLLRRPMFSRISAAQVLEMPFLSLASKENEVKTSTVLDADDIVAESTVASKESISNVAAIAAESTESTTEGSSDFDHIESATSEFNATSQSFVERGNEQLHERCSISMSRLISL